MTSSKRALYEECEKACRSFWNDAPGMPLPLRLVVARCRVKLMQGFPEHWPERPEWLELQEVVRDVSQYADGLRLGSADNLDLSDIVKKAHGLAGKNRNSA